MDWHRAGADCLSLCMKMFYPMFYFNSFSSKKNSIYEIELKQQLFVEFSSQATADCSAVYLTTKKKETILTKQIGHSQTVKGQTLRHVE